MALRSRDRALGENPDLEDQKEGAASRGDQGQGQMRGPGEQRDEARGTSTKAATSVESSLLQMVPPPCMVFHAEGFEIILAKQPPPPQNETEPREDGIVGHKRRGRVSRGRRVSPCLPLGWGVKTDSQC